MLINRGSDCPSLCCTPAIYRAIHFRKEKALEGKSKTSHSVHCPFFPDDKQEHWWCYIADRKNHALITPPNHVTSLIDREEVELKFTAPQKPGTDKPIVKFDFKKSRAPSRYNNSNERET